MPKTDLSIIIVSYNTKNVTKNCLESIVKSIKNLHCEIIVVDNGSSDGSAEMLKKIQSSEFRLQNENVKFRIIFNKKNVGFGAANNQGVKEAKSDYILLLNSDIVVFDEAIGKLISFYRNNEKDMHFLGGKLLNRDLTEQPSCGPEYSLPMIFAHLFLRADYWGLTRHSPKRLQKTDWVSGACILTKKKYFGAIGGFDKQIFMYMDEVDLFYRAKKKGMRVFFYPHAKFIHLGSASSGARTYPILQVFKGLMYFYAKHKSKLAQFILKCMLKLKALIGLSIGYILNNSYLKKTYEEAYRMVRLV